MLVLIPEVMRRCLSASSLICCLLFVYYCETTDLDDEGKKGKKSWGLGEGK